MQKNIAFKMKMLFKKWSSKLILKNEDKLLVYINTVAIDRNSKLIIRVKKNDCETYFSIRCSFCVDINSGILDFRTFEIPKSKYRPH